MTISIFLIIISITLAQTHLLYHDYPLRINETKYLEVRKTFDLLEEGRRNIILSQQPDVTLILGSSESEKSILIRWLFGDNDKLMAAPTADGTFAIVNEDLISDSTTEIKTILPALVMDGALAYYDCPWFLDARSSSQEIASTYFFKRVVDHAERVKLVFVIDHSSVRPGVDRANIEKLVFRASDLMKNIVKFHHSVALIVTKVESSFAENELEDSDASDDDAINDIAEFLTEMKEFLTSGNSKNTDLTKKAIQFLDILLMKNSENMYVRIGIFRRPGTPGPLSEDPKLRTGRIHVKKILNSLMFGSKNAEDFGYSISDGSKSDIGYLIQEIGITVNDNLDKLGNKILENFDFFVKEGRTKLENFVSGEKIFIDPDEIISNVKSNLSQAMDEISRLVGDIKSVKKPSELLKIINSSLSNLKFNLPLNDVMMNILRKQGEYFDFLQLLVSEQTFPIPKSWAANLENTAHNISILNAEFRSYSNSIPEKVIGEVELILSYVGRVVHEYHRETVEKMKRKMDLSSTTCISLLYINHTDVLKMKDSVNRAINTTSTFVKTIKNEKNLTLLFERVSKGLAKIPRNESTILRLEKFLHFLNISNKIDEKTRKSWSSSFEKEVIKLSNLNQKFETFTSSMIKLVNIEILEIIENAMKILTKYYQNLAKQFNNDVNSYVNGSLSSSNSFQVRQLLKELSQGLDAMLKFNDGHFNITNPLELAQEMQLFTSNLDDSLLNQEVANRFSCLHFLLRANNEVFTMPKDWTKIFQTTANTLTKLRDNCHRLISGLKTSIRHSISELLDDVAVSIRQYYVKLVNETELFPNESEVKIVDVGIFRDSIMFRVNLTFELTKDILNVPNVTMLADKINKSSKRMKLELSADIIENIERNCAYLNYLMIVSNRSANQMEFLSILEDKFWNSSDVLVSETQSKIEVTIRKFSESLIEYYRLKLEEAKSELKHFALNSTCKQVDVSNGKEISSILYNGLSIMSNISASIDSLSTPIALKNVLEDVISNSSGFKTSGNYLENVSLQAEILDFVLKVSGVQFHAPKRWLTPVRNARKELSASLEHFIQTEVKETREKVYALIRNHFETLAKNIIKRYENKISNELLESNEIFSSLKSAQNEVWKLGSNKNIRDLKLYLEKHYCAIDCVTELNIDKEMINEAVKRYEYLEYMRAFSNESQFHNFEPFEPVRKFLNESQVWFTFLSELDEKLSRYEIQSDASRYNVADLDNWGKVNKPQGISINKINFYKFLNKLNISGEIETVELTDSRLKTLNKIFATNFHLKFEANCECRDNILFKGNFVKFSDFIDEKGVLQNPCAFDSPNIDILAYKTIFIDRNLIAIGDQLNVSMKGPKWEIIGDNRSIVLDGKAGQAVDPDRANTGKYPGSKGYDGRAGVAGGPGGHFVGSGAIFINGVALSIRADGGGGGPGQAGGQGRDGKEGGVRFEDVTGLTTVPGVYYRGAAGLRDRLKKLGLAFSCGACGSWRNEGGCECTVFGRGGGRGGAGGKGGRGGYGGKAGRVRIIGLGSGVSTSVKPGAAGERGQAGVAGAHGGASNLKLRYEEKVEVHSRRRNDFTMFPRFEFIGYEATVNHFNDNDNYYDRNSNNNKRKNRGRG